MSNHAATNGAPIGEAVLRFANEVDRMNAVGVHRAQQDARAKGVPLVYSINGILHWELPDGSLTTEDPNKKDSEVEA